MRNTDMNKKNVIIISSVCAVIVIVFGITIAVIINKNRSTVNAATLPETTEEIAEAEPEPVPTVEPEPEPTIEPTPETENLEAKNTEEFVIESISETLMYAIATVNVRTSPSVDNARVGKLDIGDAVTFTKKATYTSTNEIWMGYYDSIHNRDLWVNSLYLSSEAPIILEENTQVNNTTVASEEIPVMVVNDDAKEKMEADGWEFYPEGQTIQQEHKTKAEADAEMAELLRQAREAGIKSFEERGLHWE